MVSAREAAFEFKKDLILKVAAENFFKKGYTKTRIDDITSALGVTKPYIYYHFSSKLEILEEICGRTSVFAADLAESAVNQMDGRSVVDRLRIFVRNFSLRVIEERMFLSIYFSEIKSPAETDTGSVSKRPAPFPPGTFASIDRRTRQRPFLVCRSVDHRANSYGHGYLDLQLVSRRRQEVRRGGRRDHGRPRPVGRWRCGIRCAWQR